MTEQNTGPYPELTELARRLEKDWAENERVDWDEAEQLVALCRAIPTQERSAYPQIEQLVDYATGEEEWDSGYVAGWPYAILTDLSLMDHQYRKRFVSCDDQWEVRRVMGDGSSEWLADVVTEAVADRLIEIMSKPRPDGEQALEYAVTAEALFEAASDALESDAQDCGADLQRLLDACQAAPAAVSEAVPEIGQYITAARARLAEPTSDEPFPLEEWAQRVYDALSCGDPQFIIEDGGDNWDVKQVALDGTESWVATVDTESVARWLAVSYPNPLAPDPAPPAEMDSSPSP